MKQIYLLLIGLIWVACQPPGFNPEEVIQASVRFSGGRISDGRVDFQINELKYRYARQGEDYSLERSFADSTALVRDILNKKGFMRMVDSLTEILPDSAAQELSETLEAEMRIAMLPFSIDSYAATAVALGLDSIGSELLFRIRVPLGTDSEPEVLHCWFNPDSSELRFAAYAHTAWGDGPWFYEVINHQTAGGVRFSDFIRYHPAKRSAGVDALNQLFNEKQLMVADTIRLRNIRADLR